MTDSQNDSRELRDSIQMWVELAVHKFNAKDGAVVLGDCSRESVEEVLKLITQRDLEQREIGHMNGMQFALACTDGNAEVEYPTDHTPISSTVGEWLSKLERESLERQLKKEDHE